MRKPQKVAGVAFAAVLAAGVLGGGTFATLSDQETAANNTVGAGTLDLTLGDDTAPVARIFDDLTLAPGVGQDEWVKVASRSGTATPDANLFVQIVNMAGSEDGCQGGEGKTIGTDAADPDCDVLDSGGDFLKHAEVAIVKRSVSGNDGGQGGCYGGPDGVGNAGDFSGGGSGEGYAIQAWTPLADVLADEYVVRDENGTPILVAPGSQMCLGAAVRLPADADNDVQGDTITFDLQMTLRQVTPQP